MQTQTRNRNTVRRGLLDVVVRSGSEAEAAYESAVLAPGFGPEPGLDLRFFGGRTLPHLRYTLVYLGTWDADERTQLDHALAAAMRDRGLNNMLAQYFPGTHVTATFAGSLAHPGRLPERVVRSEVESLSAALDGGSSVTCLLLPKGAVLVDTGDVDSKHGLGGYHGSVKVNGNERYYAVAVYSEGDNGIAAFDEPLKIVCARRAPIPTSRTRSAWARRPAPTACSAGTRRAAVRSATSPCRRRAATSISSCGRFRSPTGAAPSRSS